MKLDKLNYFVNRPCSVFTSPINRDFKQENPKAYPGQLLAYFTGFVESVDEFGVMLKHFTGSQKTYILLPNIVAIAEESIEPMPEPKIEAVAVPEMTDMGAMRALSGQMKQQFGK
jgi:hypothetical protein